MYDVSLDTLYKVEKGGERTYKEPLRPSKLLSEGIFSRAGGFARRPDLAKQGSTAN